MLAGVGSLSVCWKKRHRSSDGIATKDGMNEKHDSTLFRILTLLALINVAHPSRALAALTDGLIGYWKFDGHARDYSTNAYDMNLVGGVGSATGLLGQALSLTGDSGKYAIRPMDDALYDFGGGDFTVQAWANFTNVAGEQALVEKFTGTAGPGWTISKLADGSLIWYGDPNPGFGVPAGTFSATGTWYHVVVRRNGSVFDIRVNGGILATTTNAGAVSNADKPLMIGRRDGGQLLPVKGRIDEVAIWSRALTDTESTNLYQNGSGQAIPIQEADMAISVTGNTNSVQVGEPVTYTIAAQNAGPSNAVRVVVDDTLPAVLSYNAANSSSGWTLTNGLMRLEMGTLAAGASTTVTICAVATGSGNALVTNRVAVWGLSSDTNEADNADDCATLVTPAGYTLTPASQALELWLKADALTLNDSDQVDTWPDSSGWGRNATQTGAARPQFRANVVNGIPALSFDGSDDSMKVADNDVWAFGDFDFFIVLRIQTISTWHTRAWLAQDEGGGTTKKWIWSHDGAMQVWHINSPGVGSEVKTGANWAPSSTQFYVLELRKQGSNYLFAADGWSNGAFTCAISIPNANTPLTIGVGESSPPFSGDIAEVLLYSAALAERERQRTGYYLQRKYGLGGGSYVWGATQQMDVISGFGAPTPAVGTNRFPYGARILCEASNQVLGVGTQYVARWTLTGNDPASGASNTFALVLTNDATLAWLWLTNYWFAADVTNGTLDVANGWIEAGTNLTATATPWPYYHFAAWDGETNGSLINSNSITAPMTRARAIMAWCAANLATNDTPEWWLAAYGFTGRVWEVEAMDDQDQDGMTTWREYQADTSPTDKASVLAITGLARESGGWRVGWQGGAQATQYLLTRGALESTTDQWQTMLTNVPPTAAITNFLDSNALPSRLFYRIRVER